MKNVDANVKNMLFEKGYVGILLHVILKWRTFSQYCG